MFEHLSLPDFKPWQEATKRIADSLESIAGSLETLANYADAAHADLLEKQRRGR